ncbi:hypothetical protein BN8_00472 [Fibrisoma limi BUZ 3]|uniref:Uncharacterized protein n=1 Tax=Fibrisoma limi BUZ 3 TaxID=1185876 RepID=I2GCB9_9BACT|nr:hypothetical protein BN8_00472 [Fibrisoma limi BUZ 3]
MTDLEALTSYFIFTRLLNVQRQSLHWPVDRNMTYWENTAFSDVFCIDLMNYHYPA